MRHAKVQFTAAQLLALIAACETDLYDRHVNARESRAMGYVEDAKEWRNEAAVLTRLVVKLRDAHEALVHPPVQQPPRKRTREQPDSSCPECERSHGPHYSGPCEH